MKWTENGVTFEGTVAEYKELHSDGYWTQLTRTRAGRHVTVIVADCREEFTSIKEAAAWISQQCGRYVSASTLGKTLKNSDAVNLAQFGHTASLFETPNRKGEEEYDK